MQKGFLKQHYTNWVLLFFGAAFLIITYVFRADVIKPEKKFSFIKGRVADFSYGSYQRKKSRGFGTVTRYGFKILLEDEIHVFNINELTKKVTDRLKQALSSRSSVFIYYDKVILTKSGTQVRVHDIVVGQWSLKRTQQRTLLYFTVVGLAILLTSIAVYRLFKDYQYIKVYVKD